MNILKKVGLAIFSNTIVFGSGAALALTPTGQAACNGAGGNCNTTGVTVAFSSIANVLIVLVGAISVIMVVIGGLRYVLSGGDPSGTKDAKNTVLYALIGVAVAILSFAMVNFVISKIH